MRDTTPREAAAIIDGLLLKIELLENEKASLCNKLNALTVSDYMCRQYIYTNREDMILDFSQFLSANRSECANNYGFDSVDDDVIGIIKDLSCGLKASLAAPVVGIIDDIRNNKGGQ